MLRNTPVPAGLLEEVGRLRLTIGRLERRFRKEVVSTLPFSPTQLSVLGAIDRLGPVRISDLATEERLSASSTSKVVAALEVTGVIERVADPGDRRVCFVRTTGTGDAWIESSRADCTAWLVDRVASLGEDERRLLMRATNVLGKVIDGDK